ncbi:helix-hairpin-helix domain-containing protein [soil metagenome]
MLRKLRFWFRNIIGLSRTETNGAIGVIVVLMVCLVVPIVVPQIFRSGYTTSHIDNILLDSITDHLEEGNILPLEERPPPVEQEFFTFDPNTASESELTKLGIPTLYAKRIINFREKGGRFYIKNDLMKIYDFPREVFDNLYAYIDLPEVRQQQKLAPSQTPPLAERRSPERRSPVLENFDINEADTTQLKLIRGIGSAFSKRIINYRNSLGGFISIDQLSEVYGLQDEALQNILALAKVADDFLPRKIRINHATSKELASHPYINFQLANRLVAYREQHGHFNEADRFTEIKELDKESLVKIHPYLDFD